MAVDYNDCKLKSDNHDQIQTTVQRVKAEDWQYRQGRSGCEASHSHKELHPYTFQLEGYRNIPINVRKHNLIDIQLDADRGNRQSLEGLDTD